MHYVNTKQQREAKVNIKTQVTCRVDRPTESQLVLVPSLEDKNPARKLLFQALGVGYV